MLQNDAVLRKCPAWPELSAKRLMPVIAESAELMSYLPDWKLGNREPDRDFIWTLIWKV